MIGFSKATAWLLCLFLIGSIVCRNGTAAMFFIGDAACWVIACLVLVINLQGIQKIIAEGIFLLSINNLLDEVIFDPTKTGINEWVFFALVAVWVLKRIHKHGRTRHQERSARVHN